MAYHQGRLIDHVHLRVADLTRSKNFYKAVFQSLGRIDAFGEAEGCFYADEFFVDQAADQISHVHLAFQARDRDAVDRFYAAAIAAGGRDNGAPGLRTYHQQYYAAFVMDPDGNNIEAVCHAPERSIR
jgi:catechol 2,3-dioxygenase-like lactoylglutathione lyase family enzyme